MVPITKGVCISKVVELEGVGSVTNWATLSGFKVVSFDVFRDISWPY